MNLKDYDVLLVNSSAGKDSQAMLDLVVELADQADVIDRVVVVHADLGRVEWQGTRALAEEQARHYGVRFEVVRRTQNDLLDHVKARGRWPGMGPTRYCTSDHKRGPVRTLMTRLVRELDEMSWRKGRPVRILNCMGMRAAESPARAKMRGFEHDKASSNSRRHVDKWLPIHAWTEADVWQRIRESGVRHHPAYDLGMPRLSCVFCIYAPRDALMLAGQHNPELLSEYVSVERLIRHKFKADLAIEEIQDALARGERAERPADWAM